MSFLFALNHGVEIWDGRIAHLKIYLVGGAVRDELLGRPVKERDWVIVGATPEALIALDYQPVGKDFPVFLHPETHEEYALARTERKTGKGYKGFTFHTSPDVTLEEDLKRRDLTVNAIAKTSEGELIDPFDGQSDLNKKILRHVSPAFKEDPVRILRVARFAAKLSDFTVCPETNELMKEMVSNGEVDALVAERVWQEFSRALEEAHPERFFEVLDDCHALHALFPEIKMSNKGLKCLQAATLINHSGPIRFAALLHELSKKTLTKLCERYRIPREYRELAQLISQRFKTYQNITTANAKEVLALIRSIDALRRPERFKNYLKVCHACTLKIDAPYDQSAQAELLNAALQAIKDIKIKPLLEKNLKGRDFAEALYNLQIEIIDEALQAYEKKS